MVGLCLNNQRYTDCQGKASGFFPLRTRPVQVKVLSVNSHSPENPSSGALCDVNRPRDDVRMSLPPDYDDEPSLTLAPLDPETEAARQRIREAERQVTLSIEDVSPPRPWQFSLRQLFLANTALAIALGLCQMLAPGLIAGAFGVAALAMLVFVTVYQPDGSRVYTVAWGLLFIYLFIAGIALLRG